MFSSAHQICSMVPVHTYTCIYRYAPNVTWQLLLQLDFIRVDRVGSGLSHNKKSCTPLIYLHMHDHFVPCVIITASSTKCKKPMVV